MEELEREERKREEEKKRSQREVVSKRTTFCAAVGKVGKKQRIRANVGSILSRCLFLVSTMMTLYNDHDAIPVLLQLLRSTTLYTYYIWCLSVSLLWWSRHDTIPLRAKRASREYIIPVLTPETSSSSYLHRMASCNQYFSHGSSVDSTGCILENEDRCTYMNEAVHKAKPLTTSLNEEKTNIDGLTWHIANCSNWEKGPSMPPLEARKPTYRPLNLPYDN